MFHKDHVIDYHLEKKEKEKEKKKKNKWEVFASLLCEQIAFQKGEFTWVDVVFKWRSVKVFSSNIVDRFPCRAPFCFL